MVQSLYHRFTLLLFLGALLSGCAGSQPARFYTLHPLQGAGGLTERKESAGNLIIAVGPIKFPDHLNRPEVVTRTAQTRMNFSEFNLWAGSLPENFANTLIDNLSALLAKESVILLAHRTRPGVVDYQLLMEVLHFEGPLGGEVSLVARWTIVQVKDKQWLFVQSSSIREPTGGPGYEPFVGAQSRALERLSREIAEAIQELPR
jgi:uncharacterized protein